MPKNKKFWLQEGWFIGSHLCEKLIENNSEVACLDNFYTGNMQNINHLLDEPNFKLIEHDVTTLDLEVDQIFNAACPASPVHYQTALFKQTKLLFWGR